jgi:hypothetical protein
VLLEHLRSCFLGSIFNLACLCGYVYVHYNHDCVSAIVRSIMGYNMAHRTPAAVGGWDNDIHILKLDSGFFALSDSLKTKHKAFKATRFKLKRLDTNQRPRM